MEQNEFIKGKWYKDLGGDCSYIAKFEKVSDEKFWAKEWIIDNKYRKNSYYTWISSHNAIEADMLEVSKFLPKGHPDKLVGLPEEYIVKCDTNAEANKVFEEVYGYDNSHYITSETIILVDSATKAQHKGRKGRAYWSTIPSSYSHYPVFTYETWTKLKNMKEEFKLPEKWYVLYSTIEEFDMINDYFDKGWEYIEGSMRNGYFSDVENKANNWINRTNWDVKTIKALGYTEITFEQFKKYVMKDKKLLGYKCPTDLWGGDVKKGSVFKYDNYCKCNYTYNEQDCFRIAQEIVETWEPVYEEESINLNFGDTRITVKKGQGYVSLQEGNISKAELKQIIDHFSKGPKMLGYEGKADKVIYGCKNGTLDELVKIYNTI